MLKAYKKRDKLRYIPTTESHICHVFHILDDISEPVVEKSAVNTEEIRIGPQKVEVAESCYFSIISEDALGSGVSLEDYEAISKKYKQALTLAKTLKREKKKSPPTEKDRMESGNEGEVIDLSRSETAYIALELPAQSTTNTSIQEYTELYDDRDLIDEEKYEKLRLTNAKLVAKLKSLKKPTESESTVVELNDLEFSNVEIEEVSTKGKTKKD